MANSWFNKGSLSLKADCVLDMGLFSKKFYRWNVQDFYYELGDTGW